MTVDRGAKDRGAGRVQDEDRRYVSGAMESGTGGRTAREDETADDGKKKNLKRSTHENTLEEGAWPTVGPQQ